MNISISVDDGTKDDIRIAKLCEKYNIACTFYWPVDIQGVCLLKGWESLKPQDEEWIARNFEIGSHTITHRYLTQIPIDEAIEEIVESKKILERKYGKPVTKFAPPRGYTNKELTKITLEHYSSQRLTTGEGLVHVHPDSGANGNRPWRSCITESTTELWMHSWELERFGLWKDLEMFLKEVVR